MILYDNGFIKLDYDASTDILHVNCPDVYEHELLFIHQTIGVVLENLVNYNIKNFLLDTSNAGLDLSSESHGIVMTHLATGLVATRLQKFARIISIDTAREKRVEAFVKTFYQEERPAIEFQNFTSKTDAMKWLMAS